MNDKSDTSTFAIDVVTRFPGGSETSVRLQCGSATMNAAQLIRAKITAEWQTGVPVGRESAPLDARPAASPWSSLEDAICNALDAYRAGWYVIQVDGEQPGGLDTSLRIIAGSSVRFIRLYPVEDS